MRNSLMMLVLVLIAGLLQTSYVFQNILSISGVAPDLLLILITYVGFKRGGMQGQLIGFGSGMFQQFFSSALFGLYAFQFTVVGFIMGLTQRKVFSDNFVTAIVLTMIATLIKGLALGILSMFFIEVAQRFPLYLKNNLLLELLYNAILAGPVFWLLNRVLSVDVE